MERRISAGSAPGGVPLSPFIQYRMTMAIAATPHSFFSCLTKGTSSHTPEGSAAVTTVHKAIQMARILEAGRGMARSLPDHQDQNEYRRRQGYDDVSELFVGERARREVLLGFFGLRGQAGELFVAQKRDRFLDFRRINARAFQSFLNGGRRNELFDLYAVLLPDLRCGSNVFSKVGRRDDVFERRQRLRQQEDR